MGFSMLILIKLLYAWLLPPGLFILALAVVYGFGNKMKKNAGLLPAIILIYLLSITAVSDHLIKSLEEVYPQPAVSELQSADAIVMLGGGSCGGVPDFDGEGQVSADAANRLFMALRLHKRLRLPVILSGGQVHSYSGTEAEIEERLLQACGVDGSFLLKDAKSRNTAENALYTRQLCQERGFRKVVLVTSAYHMPRSVLFFRRAGVDVIPYPTDYKTHKEIVLDAFVFTPSAEALRNTAISLKEYLGIVAVKMGWQ